MIQLKVHLPTIRPQPISPILSANAPAFADITQLHRQLRRLSRRVRQRPEKEAGRDNWSVQPKPPYTTLPSLAIQLLTPSPPGDRIVVVVQKQRAAGSEGSGTALANKVRRGDIRHAVIVRVKKELQRVDGTVVRFGDNACVLVNKSGDPIGTRMTGVVGQELRDKQWSKILSLAPVNV
ncbi:unnamed protein product [Penicillium pancosmium]